MSFFGGKSGCKIRSGDVCLIATFAFFFGALYFFSFFDGGDTPPVIYSQWNYILTVISVAAGVITLGYFALMAFLVYFYRPSAGMPDEKLPRCTVVVPAYNEGKQIAETIACLLECDYPAEKLEVIAIDDGSKDDTRYWIKRATDDSDGRVKPVFLDRNGGKKAALYLGFKRAEGEIVITLDSDSFIEKDALRNLVAPFSDASVGAVAGNIRILNREESFYLKMLDVSFSFTFDFMRCAQSRFGGTVLCTPGALSAYRRSSLLPVIDEWLHQTFMGAPSTIGEDRALSSLLLCKGYRVKFQQNAVARTRIPTTYVRICRMYLRWIRSDIRENIRMTPSVFGFDGKWTWRRLMLQINLLFQNMSVMMPVVFLPSTLAFMIANISNLPLILLIMSFITMAWAMIPAVIYAERYSPLKSIWAFAYSIFFLFGLSWIPFYSLFTMGNGDWMTRELVQQGREKEAIEARDAR
ncbi:MAG: glycosyltransferase [Victivallaceae bacterium]|nr:glycosyltransferase [Victivallaceae bacterium]